MMARIDAPLAEADDARQRGVVRARRYDAGRGSWLGIWPQRARETIVGVLLATGHSEPADVLAAIDAAYPFGPREHYPYKMWLRDRKVAQVALGLAEPRDRRTGKRMENAEQMALFNGRPEAP